MVLTRAAFYAALVAAGSLAQSAAWAAPGSNPNSNSGPSVSASLDDKCSPLEKNPSKSKPCKGNNGFGNGGGDGVPGNSGKTDTDR